MRSFAERSGLIDPNGLDCVYADALIGKETGSGTVGAAIINEKTGLLQVGSNDGANVYYSTFAPNTKTNENGTCVSVLAVRERKSSPLVRHGFQA